MCICQISVQLSVSLFWTFQLLYRDGIVQTCPEGTQWIRVEGCEDLNLTQISVGPSGLLWAIQWDGTALIRVGITHQNPIGLYPFDSFFINVQYSSCLSGS